MKRRKMRRYRSIKKNSGVKLLGFIGIMIGAVICGYLTARFVVAPLLGYETEVLKLDFPSRLTSLLENNKESQPEADSDAEAEDKAEAEDEDEAADSYALQFGLFTSKDGAQTLKEKLQKENIKTEIQENDGKYKVLKGGFTTKEAALKELESLKDKKDIDVFITVLK